MFSSFYFTSSLKKMRKCVDKKIPSLYWTVFVYLCLFLKTFEGHTTPDLLYRGVIPCVETLSGQIVLSVKEDLHLERLYTCPPSASMGSLLMLKIKHTIQVCLNPNQFTKNLRKQQTKVKLTVFNMFFMATYKQYMTVRIKLYIHIRAPVHTLLNKK